MIVSVSWLITFVLRPSVSRGTPDAIVRSSRTDDQAWFRRHGRARDDPTVGRRIREAVRTQEWPRQGHPLQHPGQALPRTRLPARRPAALPRRLASRQALSLRATIPPHQDRRAWMTHPRRMNTMAGTSTPYELGGPGRRARINGRGSTLGPQQHQEAHRLSGSTCSRGVDPPGADLSGRPGGRRGQRDDHGQPATGSFLRFHGAAHRLGQAA